MTRDQVRSSSSGPHFYEYVIPEGGGRLGLRQARVFRERVGVPASARSRAWRFDRY